MAHYQTVSGHHITHPHCCAFLVATNGPLARVVPRPLPVDQYLLVSECEGSQGRSVHSPHFSAAPHSQLILGCQLSLHAGACNYFYNRLHSREQSIKQDYTTLGLRSLIALIYLHPSSSVLSLNTNVFQSTKKIS